MRFNIVHNYIFIIIDDINNYIHKSQPETSVPVFQDLCAPPEIKRKNPTENTFFIRKSEASPEKQIHLQQCVMWSLLCNKKERKKKKKKIATKITSMNFTYRFGVVVCHLAAAAAKTPALLPALDGAKSRFYDSYSSCSESSIRSLYRGTWRNWPQTSGVRSTYRTLSRSSGSSAKYLLAAVDSSSIMGVFNTPWVMHMVRSSLIESTNSTHGNIDEASSPAFFRDSAISSQ